MRSDENAPQQKGDIHLHLRISRRAAKLLALGALGLTVAVAAAETLTLVASYPSPIGIYKQLVSTAKTVLARDGGFVGIGTGPNPPAHTLDVVGDISASKTISVGRLPTAQQPNPPVDGTLYYDTDQKQFLGVVDGVWSPFGGTSGFVVHTVKGSPQAGAWSGMYVVSASCAPGGYLLNSFCTGDVAVAPFTVACKNGVLSGPGSCSHDYQDATSFYCSAFMPVAHLTLYAYCTK